MKKIARLALSFTIFLIILLALYILYQMYENMKEDFPRSSSTDRAILKKVGKEQKGIKNLRLDLVDPSEAPQEIKDYVLKGYQIMLHTHKELPEYAVDSLNCTNCHFSGGISTGGVDGGISLVGVAAKYPTYNKARARVEDLPQRINNCFVYSMNGKPLPLDHPAMLALVTYLHWISANFPIYAPIPWLSTPPLKTKHHPDAAHGKVVYETHCAPCHGQQGEGSNDSPLHPGTAVPPVWGQHSFNASAGMNQLPILSSFIFHNMPYEEPHLSAEDALDVAAFMIANQRPSG